MNEPTYHTYTEPASPYPRTKADETKERRAGTYILVVGILFAVSVATFESRSVRIYPDSERVDAIQTTFWGLSEERTALWWMTPTQEREEGYSHETWCWCDKDGRWKRYFWP